MENAPYNTLMVANFGECLARLMKYEGVAYNLFASYDLDSPEGAMGYVDSLCEQMYVEGKGYDICDAFTNMRKSPKGTLAGYNDAFTVVDDNIIIFRDRPHLAIALFCLDRFRNQGLQSPFFNALRNNDLSLYYADFPAIPDFSDIYRLADYDELIYQTWLHGGGILREFIFRTYGEEYLQAIFLNRGLNSSPLTTPQALIRYHSTL